MEHASGNENAPIYHQLGRNPSPEGVIFLLFLVNLYNYREQNELAKDDKQG